MITQIKIDGFKAVFSSKLTLGEFTLLIGRNGAGASSPAAAALPRSATSSCGSS
jgi:predicted ATPase